MPSRTEPCQEWRSIEQVGLYYHKSISATNLSKQLQKTDGMIKHESFIDSLCIWELTDLVLIINGNSVKRTNEWPRNIIITIMTLS